MLHLPTTRRTETTDTRWASWRRRYCSKPINDELRVAMRRAKPEEDWEPCQMKIIPVESWDTQWDKKSDQKISTDLDRGVKVRAWPARWTLDPDEKKCNLNFKLKSAANSGIYVWGRDYEFRPRFQKTGGSEKKKKKLLPNCRLSVRCLPLLCRRFFLRKRLSGR